MIRKLMVVIVLVLVLLPATALAQDVSPENYCTTVTATQEQGLTTYVVNATGAGRWARVVEYPVASPAVVVTVQDFGVGATVYQFQHVALSAAHQYQVQMSHTSATAGFSTSGCVFAPAPLFNQFELLEAVCTPSGATIQWEVISEIGNMSYAVAYNGEVIVHIESQCPGCTTPAKYSYDYITGNPNGEYAVYATSGGSASTFLQGCNAPTAVHLASLKAQTEPTIPTENLTLEFLGTLAGAALATWLTVNMLVRAQPNLKAKIIAIPAALFWTIGASVILAYPDVTVATVLTALANSLLVYFTATGGATMLAARAAEPSRAMANGKQPLNKPWW